METHVAGGSRSPRPCWSASGVRERAVAPAEACRFCAGPPRGEMVDAGGDVGRAHLACFVEWDRRQEALEAEFGRDLLGEAREIAAELEPEATVARAA